MAASPPYMLAACHSVLPHSKKNELQMCSATEVHFQNKISTSFIKLFAYNCKCISRISKYVAYCVCREGGCTWQQTSLWSS